MEKKVKYFFDYMWKDKIMTHVVLYDDGEADIINYEDHFLKIAFGNKKENIDIMDILKLYKDRVFPETRKNARHLLNLVKMKRFDPESLVRITHGALTEDNFWIRFDVDKEKNLKWVDVNPRQYFD